jgi:ribosomal protein S18 acetylase RimI-like enzyme
MGSARIPTTLSELPPVSPIAITALDLDSLLHQSALRALLDEYARTPEGGSQALHAEVLARLPEVLAASHCYAGWLAWDGDAAVGLLNGFLGVSTFRAQPLLNIHDIIVSAPWRRRGIGQALLAAAEAGARARGCCKLTLEVLTGNAPAIAAYRTAGFSPYELDPRMGQAMFFEKKL